eukprot:2607400-Amphidinium_carterae.1
MFGIPVLVKINPLRTIPLCAFFVLTLALHCHSLRPGNVQRLFGHAKSSKEADLGRATMGC